MYRDQDEDELVSSIAIDTYADGTVVVRDGSEGDSLLGKLALIAAAPFAIPLVIVLFSYMLTKIADVFEGLMRFLLIPNVLLAIASLVLVTNLISMERVFRKKFPDPKQINFYKNKRKLFYFLGVLVGFAVCYPLMDPHYSVFVEWAYFHTGSEDPALLEATLMLLYLAVLNTTRLVLPALVYPILQFVAIRLFRKAITNLPVQQWINKKIMRFGSH
ncbi:hypothetical protein [Paenibacillus ihuae]|uniref:hypothetical protein n=1 Tax=Paenibacillus ihuae TaxID=1232431 RepID=UPI0006D559D3|nr:hypothetical protein [Paenibacillus ihuae]